MADRMYCPNCGSVSVLKKFTPGYFWVELVLWICFIIPGLIYSTWRLAGRYHGCSICKSKSMIPLSSPKAKQALKELRPPSSDHGEDVEFRFSDGTTGKDYPDPS
jgi:hypothetical protein